MLRWQLPGRYYYSVHTDLGKKEVLFIHYTIGGFTAKAVKLPVRII